MFKVCVCTFVVTNIWRFEWHPLFFPSTVQPELNEYSQPCGLGKKGYTGVGEAEAGGDSFMYRMDLDLDCSDGKRRIRAYV